MRAALRRTIETVEPWDELEHLHRADAFDWIASGRPIHRIAKPATPPKHLVSYALLLDAETRKALLIDHRLSGLWLPAGGHVEPQEEAWHAARRELAEELAVTGHFAEPWDRNPFFLTVTRTVGQAQHVDVSLWFAFAGSSADEIDADEREASAARWWCFDEIRHGPGTRFDPHLPRAIDKLSAGLDRRSQGTAGHRER